MLHRARTASCKQHWMELGVDLLLTEGVLLPTCARDMKPLPDTLDYGGDLSKEGNIR